MKLEPIPEFASVQFSQRDTLARRRSNSAPDYVLPFTGEDLDNGVSLETLLALPCPVYAYAGQITVHGKLRLRPDSLPRVNGYSLLTLNGNGSVGVKWAAIDGEKKRTLARCLRWNLTSWHANVNSTGFYMMRKVDTVAEGRTIAASLPAGLWGGFGLMRCVLTGSIWAELHLSAVNASDFWPACEYFTGVPSMEAMQARQAEELAKQEEEKIAAAKSKEERERASATLREQLRIAMIERGERMMQEFRPVPQEFQYITDGAWREPRVVTVTIARRGPSLCKKGPGGWRKFTQSDKYQEAARAGYCFYK